VRRGDQHDGRLERHLVAQAGAGAPTAAAGRW
jgi:hypothetical protein